MSKRPRILLITPDAVFRPDPEGSRTYSAVSNGRRFDSFPAELISDLFELGVDVHVVQPDYRHNHAVPC